MPDQQPLHPLATETMGASWILSNGMLLLPRLVPDEYAQWLGQASFVFRFIQLANEGVNSKIIAGKGLLPLSVEFDLSDYFLNVMLEMRGLKESCNP
jgi:hypothetical protein